MKGGKMKKRTIQTISKLFLDYFKLFLKTFEQHLPEFNIKVWNNKDLKKSNFPLTYDYIQKAKKLHGKPMIDEYGESMLNFKLEPLLYS